METKVVNKPSTFGRGWHAVPGEGKALREKQTLIDSGSESGMTQGEKSSLYREDLGGYQLFCDSKVETHPQPLPKKGGEKRVAFTLAELLITLVIIGVVATMTIPSLIQNYKDKVLETQKIKTKSVLTHAFKMLMAQNGTIDLRTTTIATCKSKSCYKTELEKVLRINSDITSTDAKTRYTFANGDKMVWNDGKIYTFLNNDGAVYGVENTNDDTYSFVVDVNGLKLPNTGGKDLCKFTITPHGLVSEECNTMISFEEIIGEGRAPVVGTATCLAKDSSGKCTKCSSGGYLSSGSCKACSAGRYSAGGTVTSCTDCPAGQYGPTKTEICGICGPGRYSLSGSASCTTCPVGSYQNEAGAKLCKRCPIGTTTSTAGAVSISACK